jgi:phosphoribosylamine--glycine ligase
MEQFLDGREYSLFVITDGKEFALLPCAKDYKRVGEGDTGPNTGGMGAVSPVPYVREILMRKTIERVVAPTIAGLHKDNIPYTGFIFFGLIECGGEPYVIEYNCRMGDPETEVVMPRLQADLVEQILLACQGSLKSGELPVYPHWSVTTMCASGGYPGHYTTGFPISFPDATEENTMIFHAGTARLDEHVVTKGGRVCACTANAATLEEAIAKSQKLAHAIHFTDKYLREDIGADCLNTPVVP